MRQKAEKLEKGKWYADMDKSLFTHSCLLKYSHSENDLDYFNDQKSENPYTLDEKGLISFTSMGWFYYIPTQEDREKYNLIDDE